MVNPDAPKIALDIDFESNHAFFFALFVLLVALGWAIRDHRRRKMEVTITEQEDRLYMAVLSILFVICIFGSYYAFRRQVTTRVEALTDAPRLQRRIEEAVAEKIRQAELDEAELEQDPIRVVFTVAGAVAIAAVVLFFMWFFGATKEAPQQGRFRPRTVTPRSIPEASKKE